MSDQEKSRDTAPDKSVPEAISLEFPNGEEPLNCEELQRQVEKAKAQLDEDEQAGA